jgi:hypothetical protein
MRGIYFYGDYCNGRIWGLRRDGGTWQSTLLLETGFSFSLISFGEDEAGEIYVTNSGAGEIYRLTDEGFSCSFSLSHDKEFFGHRGGSGALNVAAPDGCLWTAASNADWIQVISVADGVAEYAVRKNPTTETRQGTIAVADKVLTIIQAANCGVRITPLMRSVPSGGGSGSIDIAADEGCGWVAVSNNDWIQITSTAAGSGPASISYSVAANPGPRRIGTVTIAGHTFTIKQK